MYHLRFLYILTFLLLIPTIASSKIINFTASSEDNLYNEICRLVLKSAFDKTSFKLKFIPSKSHISLEDSNFGINDAETCRVSGAAKEWKNLIQIYPSISSFRGSILTNGKKYKKITSNDQLKNLKVGILRGHIYSNKITSGMNTGLVKQYVDVKGTLVDLKQDKIDVAILMFGDSSRVMSENRKIFKDIVYNNKNFIEKKLYFYVHKKNKKYIDPISNIIKTFVKNGGSKKIHSDYLKKYEVSPN